MFYPLCNSLFTFMPAATSDGTVVFFAIDSSGVIINPFPARSGYIESCSKQTPVGGFQFAPQDSGCMLDPQCKVVVTPSLSGCSFFMLNIEGQLFTFHINVIDENADFRRFNGVAANILRTMVAKNLEQDEQLKVACTELLLIDQSINAQIQEQVDPLDIATTMDFLQNRQALFDMALENTTIPLIKTLRENASTLREKYFPGTNPAMSVKENLARIMCNQRARNALSGGYATYAGDMEKIDYRPEIAVALTKIENVWQMVELPMRGYTTGGLFRAGNPRVRELAPPDFAQMLNMLVASL